MGSAKLGFHRCVALLPLGKTSQNSLPDAAPCSFLVVGHISAHVVASVLPDLDHSVDRGVLAEPMHLGCAGTPAAKVAVQEMV
jgi:hypothetical protein